MEIVWLWNATPNSASSRLATAPTATRAVVSRALARSRTFRTSSNPYLIAPGQVGVAGPHPRDAFDLGLDRLDGHLLGPVHPVAVLHPERDRRAERVARGGRRR